MDFGIALASTTESWRAAKRAEALGFKYAWFYDTQLLNPDVFVCMALAARETKRIRLGTGVLIPSNRISPVAANGLATLAKLAPGRIDFGVGTGFTGRRTMGQDAIKLAEMERYIAEVRGLLRGETVEALLEGEKKKIRFLNPELGLIHLGAEIPLHLSAFGPNARALVAKLGAGWAFFSGAQAPALGALAGMQASWKSAGRSESLYANLFTLGCVLAPGERPTSKRALAQAGPLAAVLFHDLVERSTLGEVMGALPPFLSDAVGRYAEMYQKYEPADARWLAVHRGHLMFVRPEERPFLTRELIEAFTFTGRPDALRGRVEELRDAGYAQLTIQLVEGQESALADWAKLLGPLGLRKPVRRTRSRRR
ncbi:MAG: LLM class flavin-dependent oxidoreductase [Deltaproteobacteria bacterium]|nr:LLM class flavin-dependent oxidoreductase [Deltaproteobacteria bacterium]